MELKWIEIVNFGPFAVPTKLMLDPRVTVLTGANDTGKSSVLKAIEFAFTTQLIESYHVNQEHIDSSGKAWKDDAQIVVHFGLCVTERTISEKMAVGPVPLKVNDELVGSRRLNGPAATIHHVLRDGNKLPNSAMQFPKLAQIVVLAANPAIRDILPLKQLNDAEFRLLKLGFGETFTPDAHLALNEANRVNRTGRAETKLNNRLAEILPPATRIRFHLTQAIQDGSSLSLSLSDSVDGYVGTSRRGAGPVSLRFGDCHRGT